MNAHLIISFLDYSRKYFLEKTYTSVGRSKDCDIVIPFTEISRCHCVFVERYKSYFYHQVIDGGRDRRKMSANGVFVNDRRIDQVSEELKNGDVIRLGFGTTIKYVFLNQNFRSFLDEKDTSSELSP